MTSLLAGDDYYLFKKGIKPEWEAQENLVGGKWTIEFDRHLDTKKLWEETMMFIIGEQFGEPKLNEQICGAVFQLRGAGNGKVGEFFG